MKEHVSKLFQPASTLFVRTYLRSRFSGDPIIVGGPPRSGTTLLLSLLGSHSNIHAVDYETTAFHPAFQPLKLFTALFFENESRTLRRLPHTKKRFAEKTPGNIRHAVDINDFFRGKVRILNIFRDARDVLTSRHPLDPNRYWVPIERWIEDVKKGLDAEHYSNVHSIKYEALVEETETTIKNVCDFIGERYEPRMLEYQKYTNVQQNLAWDGKALAIHAASMKKWERPEHSKRLKELVENEEAMTLSRRLGYF